MPTPALTGDRPAWIFAPKCGAETDIPAINLITCVMVLEHMHQPRTPMAELIKASVRHACPLSISVPFFDRNWWHYLREPVGEAFHPFAQPRLHVSRFAHEGFEKAARSLGAGHLTAMTRRTGWPGYLIHPPTRNPAHRAD